MPVRSVMPLMYDKTVLVTSLFSLSLVDTGFGVLPLEAVFIVLVGYPYSFKMFLPNPFTVLRRRRLKENKDKGMI